MNCRCCGEDQLSSYLDLGVQPLANDYHDGKRNLEEFPLEIMLCENCFHSQLSVVVPPHKMFKNYLYVSGTTTTFKSHCDDIAKDAFEMYETKYGKIDKSISVLDIACNDGTLLKAFLNAGRCKVQGVDPAENLRQITKNKKLRVKVGYWGDGKVCQHVGKYEIITGTNVFAHVANLSNFLDDSIHCMTENGFLILEFPYCDEMISKCEFDTIYHEHLSYFLVNSFKALVDQKKLGIVRVLQTKIHGGSIRFFLQKDAMHDPAIDVLIEKEKAKGLLSKETYQDFGNKVEKNKIEMVELINRLRSEGKKIIGYGASAKGNTMLNYFEIDLDYIVDDNDLKWRLKTPGRNIQIMPSEEMVKEEGELWIVILAWNFYDEIIGRIEKICGRSHHYIRYVPEVTET